MAGFPHMYETMFGAGGGYYDAGDSPAYGADAGGPSHASFICWLAVFTLAGVAILGGLRAGGFHFVVKT